MKKRISLEPEARQISNANSKPPFIFQLPPAQGRAILNKAQNSPVFKWPAQILNTNASTGKWGDITVHFVIPENLTGTPNVIFYIHGAGWVLGNLHTHDKLVRELGARTNSIVIFPEYSLSPEAKYPTAIEQCFSVLCQLPELSSKIGLTLNLTTLTVAGDSVGGNMATVMTIMAKAVGGPAIHKQLLYYPVTSACFCTESYLQFSKGYYLYREGMMWFWNQYTSCEKDRKQITASPLCATTDQLRDLPAAMILNGEADVLRDEGEAYAVQLREAGVDVTAVRFQGTIHDFVMLNALDQSNACRAAMDVSCDWINRKNCPCQ